MMPYSSYYIREASIGNRQRNFANLLSVILIASGVVATPFANLPWFPVPAYMTAFGSSMLAINAMLATLLFSRGATEQDSRVLMLGTAYFFVAIIFVPLMASFPGGIVPGNLIGKPVSSVWMWSFWHAGFGLLVLRYALESMRENPRAVSLKHEVLICIVLVIFLTLLSTVGLPYMPILFSDGHRFFSGYAVAIPIAILLIDALAAFVLFRLHNQTAEQLWLMVGMLAACFDVWLTFHGSDRFSMGWYVSKLASLFTSMAVLASLFFDLTVLYKRASQANIFLTNLAAQDGLTLLANRRSFDEALEAEWRRGRRAAQPISLLMIDVDLFKKFNDRFGHVGGDECLRKVAMVLKECAKRPGDLAARYGGEEFAIILPMTLAANALGVANQIRQRLNELAIPHPDLESGFVSVSIGIATMIPGQSLTEEMAIQAADSALYQAKKAGRNCARHADEIGAIQQSH